MTDWTEVKKELDRLKSRYRPFSDIKPRPTMIRLIVWLDMAIKEVEKMSIKLKELICPDCKCWYIWDKGYKAYVCPRCGQIHEQK